MKFIVELLAYGKEGEVREVEVPNFWDDYMLTLQVADGDGEEFSDEEWLLGQIFKHGQNESQPQEKPSVSVGDVIVGREITGSDIERYLILPLGFKRLSQTDYDAYKAIPQNQRAIGLYLDHTISKL